MIRTSEPSYIDATKLNPISKEVILYVDTRLLTHRPSGTLIYLQVEPEAIIRAEDYLVNNYKLYDYIFTFNETVLKVCPNAIKYIFGTTWISSHVYSSIDTERKRFEISTIIGNKLLGPGHHFRKAVYIAQDSLPKHVTYRFFKSVFCPITLPPTSNDSHFKDSSHEGKSEAFLDSQFHLVIENSRQVNYFTEKLCDCLITKTIPIYYGCPNISEYFNTDGWIILESDSVAELSEKLLAITPLYYSTYTGVIQQNFFTVMNHKDIHTNINKALKKIE
jgi:hypothetical protein